MLNIHSPEIEIEMLLSDKQLELQEKQIRWEMSVCCTYITHMLGASETASWFNLSPF